MKRASLLAFTLVELLTVISIVSLLAALLFPVFLTARKRAYTATCVSNLRQIGTAIAQYTTDYDGRIPYAAQPETATAVKYHLPTGLEEPDNTLVQSAPDLRTVLKPYGATQFLFQCPADYVPASLKNGVTWPDGEKSTWYEGWGSSYSYAQERALRGQSLTDVSSLAQIQIMCDSYSFHKPDKIVFMSDFGVNFLFADTHVKMMSGRDAALHTQIN